MMAGFGIVGLFLMLIFWVGVISLAVWLIQTLFQSSNRMERPFSGHKPNPKEILAQRYARGEITREQYEMMKVDIS